LNTTSQIEQRTILIKQSALDAGCMDVGIAKVELLTKEYNFMLDWLDNGHHASMEYLARNGDKREDIQLLLPNAKSVIVCAINYYTAHRHIESEDTGKISRYAWGTDYHEIVPPMLLEIENTIKSLDSTAQVKRYVDTGPVMEKAWAVRAGVGWQGKNSNIISKKNGSFFFLGVIITDMELQYDSPIGDYCGTCTACIDSCPTSAIISPGVVSAQKCIPYWTIEAKPDVEIPNSIKENLDNWLFGCDICQDVCPWNRFSKPTTITDFEPRQNETSIPLEKVGNYEQEEFSIRFKKSPIKRTKLMGLKRNAKAISERK
jgi:epoxyqueuosine reductase